MQLILKKKKKIEVPLPFTAIITLCSSLQPRGDLGSSQEHRALNMKLLVKNSAQATGGDLVKLSGSWSLL